MLFPDPTVIRDCIARWTGAPAAFGIDFGITPDSKTLLIEVNDGRSLGNYGLSPQVYALFLEAHWDEMAFAEPR